MGIPGRPLFDLGQIVATPAALDALAEVGVPAHLLLLRHIMGDWAELDSHDRKANKDAVKDGTRVFSAYTLKGGLKVWVITEADRSSTCVLLPSELLDHLTVWTLCPGFCRGLFY